jgi:hypothetical protein
MGISQLSLAIIMPLRKKTQSIEFLSRQGCWERQRPPRVRSCFLQVLVEISLCGNPLTIVT